MVPTTNPTQCLTLPVFHAFTDCDTISSFAGRGKKTAWESWKLFPVVNGTFNELLCMPSEVNEGSMLLLERFVVLMHDRTSESKEVNDAKKQLFTQKSRTLENIPWTQAALKQHIKRTWYQANCWIQALVMDSVMPDPSDWGWTKDTTGWHPLWTTFQFPEAWKSCLELYQLWLQERVHWTLELCQSCTQVRCTVLLLWRLLDFDHYRPIWIIGSTWFNVSFCGHTLLTTVTFSEVIASFLAVWTLFFIMSSFWVF